MLKRIFNPPQFPYEKQFTPPHLYSVDQVVIVDIDTYVKIPGITSIGNQHIQIIRGDMMKKSRKISPLNSSWGYMMVVFLNFLQAIGRLSFAMMGLNGGIDQFLDVPVSQATTSILHAMFFLLGMAGFVATVGLWRRYLWGFWAVLSVSIITILFDIWGFSIQKTAALGFIVPVISIFYLMSKKSHLMAQ